MAVEMRSNNGGRGGDNNNDRGYGGDGTNGGDDTNGGDGGCGYGGDGDCHNDCSGVIMVVVMTIEV